jgi:hypothetical protein
MEQNRRHFLGTILAATAATATGNLQAKDTLEVRTASDKRVRLIGNRFLTFNAVVRVNQIEATRSRLIGQDEASLHTPEVAQAFRDAFEKGWPGGRMTWAFSWLALQDPRDNYKEIRRLVVEFHRKYGDEITFIPGGYFANMYNSQEQVNADIHEALQRVTEMVGGGYRPRSIVAGFLSAANQRHLAEKEDIHVCQGNIWSQYAVDNGDGEGSISYPYYPSTEHLCKPAQGKTDFIDCVNLDGWTCDFVSARRAGCDNTHNSRMGLGPIETFMNLPPGVGHKEIMATTAAHFDQGFDLNQFAWGTTCWELSLLKLREDLKLGDSLSHWLSEVHNRWPKAQCITQGEFGLIWRNHFHNNAKFDYRFKQRGSGIFGSDANLEVTWAMNKDFRLALLRDWKTNDPAMVIDFTRYDLTAEEPKGLARNWSLMNRLNQKGIRPQDKPIPISELTAEERKFIDRRCPDLLRS